MAHPANAGLGPDRGHPPGERAWHRGCHLARRRPEGAGRRLRVGPAAGGLRGGNPRGDLVRLRAAISPLAGAAGRRHDRTHGGPRRTVIRIRGEAGPRGPGPVRGDGPRRRLAACGPAHGRGHVGRLELASRSRPVHRLHAQRPGHRLGHRVWRRVCHCGRDARAGLRGPGGARSRRWRIGDGAKAPASGRGPRGGCRGRRPAGDAIAGGPAAVCPLATQAPARRPCSILLRPDRLGRRRGRDARP